MQDKLEQKTEEAINRILKEGIATTNLDHLYKLTKINHMIKEEENMNNSYGNYGGRGPGHGSYGNYNEYGNYGNYNEYGGRGVDSRYRGYEYMDRMYNEYGRYMDNRERYGASNETDKSFNFMVDAYKDFTKYLFETAETQQQKQMLRDAIQQSMM